MNCSHKGMFFPQCQNAGRIQFSLRKGTGDPCMDLWRLAGSSHQASVLMCRRWAPCRKSHKVAELQLHQVLHRPWNMRLPNMLQEYVKGVRLPFPERLWKIHPDTVNMDNSTRCFLGCSLQALSFIFTLHFHIGCTS